MSGDHLPRLCHSARHSARAGVGEPHAGTIDLKGFFAVDDDVRPGYQKVTGTVRLVSTASDEQLEMLRTAVNAHCPVLDIIQNPVPVMLDLNIERAPAVAAE